MKKSAWLRLALILVCAAMMLSLFACGGSTAAETEGSSKAPETEATEKKPDASETEKEETTETAPEADTEETESQEATTEKTVVPTETEKKPVETTEKEKPTETKEKETEPVAEPDPLDVFVKADALANASVNTGRIEKGVLSSDGKYVTFANKADGADGWMLGYTGGSVVSGQYLVIKYRFPVSNQTKATTIEIFCSTANAGPTGGDNVQLPVIADGEWHIGIVDMAKSKGAEKFPANSDGTYTIKYARFDVLNGSHKVGDTVDVAYVGIDNSLADALALVKAEGMKSAYVNVGYTAYKTYYASTGTTTPTVEDIVDVYVAPDKMTGASVNANRISGKELSADGKYITFTANGTGGDGYALLYSGGATVSGQYLVIKYRYAADNAFAQTYIEVFASCTNGGATGGDNYRIPAKADGEWHVAVVDFSKFNSKFVAAEDGTYTVKYARVDLLDANGTGEGDSVDIGYLAFTDDYSKIVAANGDVKVVDFRLGAEEIYSIYTSTGTTEPGMTDVANKYFDAADLAGKAPSGTNIGKVELSEDKSYVSIYGKGAADGYFSVFGGNTDVTGQYLVMKYRYPTTNAEGYNPTTRPMYTGNVNAGPVGGDFNQSFPVVADGEWHMTVFNVAAHIKEDFLVANEDGTYTIKYFRFDLADQLPEDCCIDVAYIAFVDDAGLENMIAVAKGEGLETVTAKLDSSAAVVYYTATGTTEPPVDDDETGTEVEGEETETETQTEGEIVEVNPDEEQGDVDYKVPFFQFNIDEINTVEVKGRSGAGTMYKDFAPYSTSIDGIIDLRGWFFGMSGVASYEFSIDGGATWIVIPDTAVQYNYNSESPDDIGKKIINKNTQLLGTPGFGVKALFRGGASLKINLSHLAHDEKVSITVSAVLNSGDRVEFLKLLDVFVACTHEDNTAEWNAIEGDIQRLASTCSACGKEVTKFIDYTIENLKLAGAGYLASKKTNDPSKIATSLRQEANGMYYAHFEVTGGFFKENTLAVWSGSTIENVDKFVAFLYRTNSNTVGTEMFISADSSLNGTHQNYPSIIVGGWQLSILDCTSKDVWTKETGVYQLRLDLFNSRSESDPYKKGDYADLAYLAFFSSRDAAIDFYATYVDTYLGAEDCAHARVSGEWQWTGVEGEYKQKATCLLCNGDVVRDCPHETKTIQPVTEKGENGELYEAIVCSGCPHRVTRPVFYHNSIDAIYGGPDGTTVINPAERNNYQQTNGVNGAPESGYLTFDATGKLIDKDKNPIQVTNVFSFSGWLGVNGGVDRYVYKINDGAWLTPSGSAATVGATSGIGKAIVGNAGIVDKTGSFKNAGYQGKLKVMGLQEYADQTINITIGAVPANNPGTAADPNVIILAVVNNLYVTCIHTGEATLTATEDPTVWSKVCNVCETDLGEVSGITNEGLKIWSGADFVTLAPKNSNSTDSKSVTAVTDENGFTYAHVECTTTTSGEKYFYLNVAGWGNVMNVDKYIAILYRASGVTANQMFVNGKGGLVQDNCIDISNEYFKDDSWRLAIFDATAETSWSKNTGVGDLRWDIFNNATTAGSYIDIAYFGFFSSEAAANAYYATFADTYGLRWTGNFDKKNCSLNGTSGAFDVPGRIADKALVIDASTFVLNDAKSLAFGGWFVTPGGTTTHKYRIVEVDGVAVENPVLVPWRTGGVSGGITQVGTGRGWDSTCGSGAAFQSPLAVDLTGFEGKTVTVEIVAQTKLGNNITWARITNIAVPAAE